MLFPNEYDVSHIDKVKQYPVATVFDRPSTFYDRVLAAEVKQNFKFDYPFEEKNDAAEKQISHSLIKKKIL